MTKKIDQNNISVQMTNSRILVLFLIFFMASLHAQAQQYVRYVDPFIGSGSHGHVFVGASVPFGAVQAGPDNFYKGWDWCSGYNYGDSVLIGFAQTHLSGTGIGDLADVLVMPYTGAVKTDKGQEKTPGSGYASRYSHLHEKAKPGYYSVKLLDYDVDVELTASERVAFHRYRFPAGKEAHVIIDLKEGINDKGTDTYIKQVDQFTLEGRRFSSGWAKDQRLYFAIRTSEPVTRFAVYDNDKLLDGKEGQGTGIKGLISFPNGAPPTLQLKIGISPVSPENALANIEAEIPHWNFQQVTELAAAKWEKELSGIQIETSSEADKRMFYTALFHTMINPSLFNDHNKDYRGADKNVYPTASFDNYSVFSLWDTYRATHPLYTLIQPERTADMINSMLEIYKQQGRLPVWHLMGNETGTMVGISSLQVIAEAYLKGLKGFDAGRAYEAVKATAMTDFLGLGYVREAKAIPYDKQSSSVARGLEYAISDHSIALMSKELGKTDDYNYFMKRANSYRLYYDPSTRFFRGISSEGAWRPDFSPTQSTGRNRDYTEGNAWQYLWLVPEHVKGLISLLGGDKAFVAKLDSFFTVKMNEGTQTLVDLTGLIGQYAHGNEPGHHIPYLYAYAGQQWKTAEKVRYILKEFYSDQPDGIIGNEDCGQMSAWAIFSSLGFYPVFPASGMYVIGSPLVNKASIRLPGGKQFVVEAVGNSAANIYIQRLELNGKPYRRSYLLHRDILKGGILSMFMGDKPNHDFGAQTAYRPQ